MAHRFALAASVVLLASLAGCAAIPADAEGTIDRARGGDLRVGVTANPPWADLDGPAPGGSEVDLLEDFADTLDADIEWMPGSEGVLVDALRAGDIDIAIGGFTDDTPWSDDAAPTDVYTEVVNDRGVTEKHVMLTRAGENRLLVELETFLREHGGDR